METQITDLSNAAMVEDAFFAGNAIDPTLRVNYQNYSGADGDPDDDTGEADTTDVSGDDMEYLALEEQYLETKLRDLIRNKKTELKAQYGKGYLYANRKITSPPKKNKGDKISLTESFALINSFRGGAISKQRGWRYQWKQFKQNGGKAQLKQQAKGLVAPPATGGSSGGNSIIIDRPYKGKPGATGTVKMEARVIQDLEFGDVKINKGQIVSGTKKAGTDTGLDVVLNGQTIHIEEKYLIKTTEPWPPSGDTQNSDVKSGEEKSGFPTWAKFAIGGVILLTGIVITVVLIRKKKLTAAKAAK